MLFYSAGSKEPGVPGGYFSCQVLVLIQPIDIGSIISSFIWPNGKGINFAVKNTKIDWKLASE